MSLQTLLFWNSMSTVRSICGGTYCCCAMMLTVVLTPALLVPASFFILYAAAPSARSANRIRVLAGGGSGRWDL